MSQVILVSKCDCISENIYCYKPYIFMCYSRQQHISRSLNTKWEPNSLLFESNLLIIRLWLDLNSLININMTGQ